MPTDNLTDKQSAHETIMNKSHSYGIQGNNIFSRVHATLQLALSVRPSVGPSVRRSVRRSVRPSVTLYFFVL